MLFMGEYMTKILMVMGMIWLAAPAYALDLGSVRAAGVPDALKDSSTAEPPRVNGHAPAGPETGTSRTLALSMNVVRTPQSRTAAAGDYANRVEAMLRFMPDGRCFVQLKTDFLSEYAAISRTFKDNSQLFGAGIKLNLSGGGGQYYISGSVTAEGKTQAVSLSMRRTHDAMSYLVSGPGVRLDVTGKSIRGNFNTGPFSKKAAAAVAALVLAAQEEQLAGNTLLMENPAVK